MKREIKNILFFSIVLLTLAVTIGFTSVKNTAKPVNDVKVHILDQNGNFFTDHIEILNLLNAENTDYVLGLAVKDLDLKTLEERIEVNPFVKDAQVFRDVKGNLIVNVKQAQPVARIFNPHGPDQYIDEEGFILPVSQRHTARVPLIELERSFSWEKNITETEYGTDILEMLTFIREDKFWNAQIAGFVIEKNGELTLMPQVSKQFVKFGMPSDLDTKFKKLKVFYKEILPNKGWNTYTSVNLKFKDQIVCE
ncbi:MAG: cell division protein FtsQ [Cyclobacteriaceae bacterium]